jgi:hypothetical protein
VALDFAGAAVLFAACRSFRDEVVLAAVALAAVALVAGLAGLATVTENLAAASK